MHHTPKGDAQPPTPLLPVSPQEIEDVFPQFWELVLLGIGTTEALRISKGWNDLNKIDQVRSGAWAHVCSRHSDC